MQHREIAIEGLGALDAEDGRDLVLGLRFADVFRTGGDGEMVWPSLGDLVGTFEEGQDVVRLGLADVSGNAACTQDLAIVECILEVWIQTVVVAVDDDRMAVEIEGGRIQVVRHPTFSASGSSKRDGKWRRGSPGGRKRISWRQVRSICSGG